MAFGGQEVALEDSKFKKGLYCNQEARMVLGRFDIRIPPLKE